MYTKFKAPCKRTQLCWPATPNIVGSYMLRPFAHPVACCWMLLRVVAQSLKPVKLFSQQLPTFLLFRDRRSVAQQCWIRLHSSSNIVGATHAHYTRFTKTYGLCPSHDALQVPTLLGVVASVCTPLQHKPSTGAIKEKWIQIQDERCVCEIWIHSKQKMIGY